MIKTYKMLCDVVFAKLQEFKCTDCNGNGIIVSDDPNTENKECECMGSGINIRMAPQMFKWIEMTDI